MQIGFIGLGKMGANMVKRLLGDGHKVYGFDPSSDARKEIEKAGAKSFASIKELVQGSKGPKNIWTMVPAGKVTDNVIEELSALLSKDDIVIDGGNSNYKDSIKRFAMLKEKGINFLDAGTSGGVWGLKEGYCLMVGGDKDAFAKVEPIFKSLAPKDGYAYIGPAGSGHFVKMVHNGIEYAMLEAYAEGFEIINSKSEFDVNLEALSKLWNHGGVIRSWLLELAVDAFSKDPKLDKIKGYVQDSGEGTWTVQEAMDLSVPLPIITLSLIKRFRSRQEESFAAKVVAALRNEFGGHAILKK
ncbi:phosphogluconate dehydrogenase (NAD(+)-dependent, decarboxylating) [bacterium]